MKRPDPIIAPGATLYYLPDFLDGSTADTLMAQLRDEVAWRQDRITVFGKTHPIPRLQAFQGDSGIQYRYSDLTLDASAWHPAVAAVRDQLALLCEQPFNCVLMNHYRNGQDKMGWHSDDEPELGYHPTIASISLGATRMFRLRHRFDKQQAPIELPLTHGSLCIMAAETQHYWQHSVPASRRITAPRINLTYRLIKTAL